MFREFPKEAIEEKIEGVVSLDFVITTKGKLEDVNVSKSLGHGCDEAAIKTMKIINEWIPGKIDNKPIDTRCTIHIPFYHSNYSDPSLVEKPAEIIFYAPSTDEIKEGLDEELVFKVVEQMPRFPGCEDILYNSEKELCTQKKMLEFVYTNIKYPTEAVSQKISGMVIAQFVVDKKGYVKNVKIIRDIGGGCGDELKRVILSMNEMKERWTPGKQRGKSVSVLYTLPVRFKL